MQGITPSQLGQNLTGWLAADAAAIEGARSLLGGGGWEQWCVIQFLQWQLATQTQGNELAYQRELTLYSGQIQRRFDVAYNFYAFNPPQGFPLVLSQWKAGNNGNTVSSGVMTDIGTLQEFTHLQGVYPLIVALSPEPVNFPGVQASGAVSGTDVQIYCSSEATWQTMSSFTVTGRAA